MKNKYIVAILVSGMVITVIGALLKIKHTEIYSITGNLLLTIGMVTEAIAGILFISKLLSNDKNDGFLNK